MFDIINKRPCYRKKHLTAPLLEERVTYLKYLDNKGRSIYTIQHAANYLLRIIKLLKLKTKRIVKREEVEKAANIYAKAQCNHPQKQKLFLIKSKNSFIQHAINWLKMIDCLETPPENVALFYKIFKHKNAINRHLSAPLLNERIKYVQYWADSGAITETLKRIAQYLLLYIDYLNLENKKLVTVTEIEKAWLTWATTKNKPLKKQADYSGFAKNRFISYAIRWLKMINRLVIASPKNFPFSEKLTNYIDYMRQQQGLSETTIYSRNSLLHNFLTLVCNKAKNLNCLDPLIIDKIIAHKLNIDKYSRRSIQYYISIVRTFLRYAEKNNWCQKGLAASIKIARNYKHESLPYSPSWDDIKKLIAKTEGNHPTNIRDRAIIMLLAVYGLRRSEVVNLELNDIDWKNELLNIKKAKKGIPQTVPLSKIVGESILRYILDVRQNNCPQRNLFICRNAPYRPLTTGAIYHIVAKKLKRLNVKIKHYGPHSLRHACATHMINTGISLKEISNYLGHQSLETTRIYAKVNLTELRKVADFDIGEVL